MFFYGSDAGLKNPALPVSEPDAVSGRQAQDRFQVAGLLSGNAGLGPVEFSGVDVKASHGIVLYLA
jgi:hypothetical protein